MKVLTDWDKFQRGYRFKEPTFYSNAHLGLDVICPAWTPLYAPFAGTSTQNNFTEGGNVIEYRCNGLVMRMMHLAKVVKTGACNAGDLIGYTGNSGTLTTGAHLHIDISKGSVQIYNINNFLDPETFNWGEDEMTPEQQQQLGNLIDWSKQVQTQFERNDTRMAGLDAMDQALLGLINKNTDALQKISDSEAIQDPKVQEAVDNSRKALEGIREIVEQNAKNATQKNDAQVAEVEKTQTSYNIKDVFKAIGEFIVKILPFLAGKGK